MQSELNAVAPFQIECHHVTKVFGDLRALMGVTVVVKGGEVTAIEGANGSGKSTLLSLLGGFTRPTSGRITWGIGPREVVRRTVGWVAHDTLLYPDLTGRENLDLAVRLSGGDREEALAKLEKRFELGAFWERPVRTYSRGQKQRVALARSVVHEPKILLLDEPTSGLDRASSERLRTVVREEAARGAAVILVTHDPWVVDGLASQRIRMDRGKVLQ